MPQGQCMVYYPLEANPSSSLQTTFFILYKPSLARVKAFQLQRPCRVLISYSSAQSAPLYPGISPMLHFLINLCMQNVIIIFILNLVV